MGITSAGVPGPLTALERGPDRDEQSELSTGAIMKDDQLFIELRHRRSAAGAGGRPSQQSDRVDRRVRCRTHAEPNVGIW
jgi:hypothetical protein